MSNLETFQETMDWFRENPGPDQLRITELTTSLGTIWKQVKCSIVNPEKGKINKDVNESITC